MTTTESQSFFLKKVYPIISFIVGPILISVGIFVLGVLWKVLLIISGSVLILDFYFLRRPKIKTSEEICFTCNGTGAMKVSVNSMAEHSVKNCLSYRTTTTTCGMCGGTGLKNHEEDKKFIKLENR